MGTHSTRIVAGCADTTDERARGLTVTTRETPGPGDPRAGGPVRLLIVDDHDMFADSLRLALSTESDLMVVGTAPSLARARQMIVSEAPDVVLLDHRLPDGLGVDSIAELKSLRPSAKIVVLTAAAEDSMLVTATEAGCAGFLLKTSPLDELVVAVRTAAAGEIMVSSDLLARLLNRLHHRDDEREHVLTAREREILELIAEGLTNGAIAKRLFISVNTVRNHVQYVLAKLDAHSKLEALSIAIRNGLIDPPGGAGSE
jgi:DNA-binding NarL/FixJ family response regulator